MNKICTDIEQSKKLIELGIDANTADMYWWYSGKRYYVESMDDDDFNKESDIPAWSLTSLIKLIPHTAHLNIDGNYWFEWSDIINEGIDYTTKEYDNPIDSVFELVVWLKENNKI